MIKLILKQLKGDYQWPYQVIGVEDTVEWDIGERMDKEEVERILKRHEPDTVKVIIK